MSKKSPNVFDSAHTPSASVDILLKITTIPTSAKSLTPPVHINNVLVNNSSSSPQDHKSVECIGWSEGKTSTLLNGSRLVSKFWH